MAKREMPSQASQDFGNWIGNHAAKNGMAVLAIVWDRKPNSASVMVIDGAAGNVAGDELGGFKRRVAHALIGQEDILETLYQAAMEKALGYGGQVVKQATREPERG